MKAGTESRKKTILAASFGAVALICILYAYSALFGGDTPSTAAPTPSTTTSAPAAEAPAPAATTTSSSDSANSSQPANMPTGNAAGVDLKVLASTSASLDPTLDESAMLRTEHLVYAGNGRNIFSATYTPPAAALPRAIASARPAPAVYVPPPPPPTCPPSCPPLPLKFFGTIQRPGPNPDRQAFLLFGDNVFLASANDVVARRYKVISISATSVQIEDLSTTYADSLPLQSN
jgi:hypothetical protein